MNRVVDIEVSCLRYWSNIVRYRMLISYTISKVFLKFNIDIHIILYRILYRIRYSIHPMSFWNLDDLLVEIWNTAIEAVSMNNNPRAARNNLVRREWCTHKNDNTIFLSRYKIFCRPLCKLTFRLLLGWFWWCRDGCHWMVPALLKRNRRNKLFLSKLIRYRNLKKLKLSCRGRVWSKKFYQLCLCAWTWFAQYFTDSGMPFRLRTR